MSGRSQITQDAELSSENKDRLGLLLKSRSITGIIFDFDGVVVDSENHWPVVENPYIEQYCTGWQDEFYGQLTGMGLSEVYDLLTSRYDFSKSKEQYFEDYEKMALELYGNIAMPIAGIEELLDCLERNHISASIASSSKPAWIRVALKKHDLDGYFQDITSSHDLEITHGKPAPDVYLGAIAKQIGGSDSLMAIEDSTNGIRAAKAAGLFCIALNIDGTNIQDTSGADAEITTYDCLTSTLHKRID